jgi:hypothetical protein
MSEIESNKQQIVVVRCMNNKSHKSDLTIGKLYHAVQSEYFKDSWSILIDSNDTKTSILFNKNRFEVVEILESNSEPKTTLKQVLSILDSDEKMEEFISSKSELYTAYSVKNNQGEFTSVIDIKSVTSIIRELLKKQTKNA